MFSRSLSPTGDGLYPSCNFRRPSLLATRPSGKLCLGNLRHSPSPSIVSGETLESHENFERSDLTLYRRMHPDLTKSLLSNQTLSFPSTASITAPSMARDCVVDDPPFSPQAFLWRGEIYVTGKEPMVATLVGEALQQKLR
ncbi:unnamed protein product [Arabis nemorensis]|uniref:Uncharacterized protein n=1 Tax=Arabis nemorensis TaxID=586526 RepID=A0A565ASF0_9BRAS|nr:unnamed protein product [Arabis nemorensis]